MKVSVLGGGGHVGLPMCLVLADSGHEVYGVDLNEDNNRLIMTGQMPFHEQGAEGYLQQCLAKQRLVMTSDVSVVKDAEVVIIVIGTPVDEHLNPVLEPLRDLILQLCPLLSAGQLIILRSTVSPGATDRVKKLIEDNTQYPVSTEIHLVFAPERVIEGRAIEEIRTLPQLIGAYDDNDYERAKDFFMTFLESECIYLTPMEAEIGKLLTNVTRYVNFALANECHLIGETFGVNINTVIDACNKDYHRMNLPSPGPNVGGPCLYKDGWFLIERIPYSELIGIAFRINEGMPMQIVQKLQRYSHIQKVAILGMAFKANSDDTRYSVSSKLRKQLKFLDYKLTIVDPHVKGYAQMSAIRGSDAVVLMTPHDEFKNLPEIMELVGNEECLYVDIWGAWPKMRYRSRNGYFFGREVAE